MLFFFFLKHMWVGRKALEGGRILIRVKVYAYILL